MTTTESNTEVQKTEQDKNETISNLLRINGCKYDTFSVDSYQQKLDEMTLNDLHAEAMRVGLKPLGNRSLTTRTLIDLFHEEVRRFTPGSPSEVKSNLNNDSRDILRSLMKNAR